MRKEESKFNVLEEMFNLANEHAEFCKDTTNTIFCYPNNKSILFDINSESFLTWIVNLARVELKMFIKLDVIKNLLPNFRAEDNLKVLDYNISKRCKMRNNKLYIDLANKENTIICINSMEVKSLSRTREPLFKRSDSMLSLPTPDLSVKPSSLMELLHEILILTKEQAVMLSAWLVVAFIESVQCPMAMVCGPKGSSKSWIMSCIVNLVDPSSNNTTMIQGNDRDLGVMLDNNFLCGFDNISEDDIKGRLSDMLCVAVTNGTYSLRTLYSDRSVTSLKLNNRIILNGISQSLLRKSDAIDRTIVFNLERLKTSEMIPMNELLARYKDISPKLLGAIFNTIREVFANIDNVEITNPSRMTEYTKYAYCACDIMGFGGDCFLEIYNDNLKIVNEKMLETDVVATAILSIMDKREVLCESVAELYARVHEVVRATNVNPRLLPGSTSHFSTKIMELQSNLKDCGILISKKNVGTHKEITIEKIK